MSRQARHAKNCLCRGCSAARLATPTPDDPLQGDLLAPVKIETTRTRLEGRWVKHMRQGGPVSADELAGLTGAALGVERKEEVLTAHDQRRRATLLWLRRQLATLYQLRKAGVQGETYRLKPYVTADDAELLLRSNPDMNPGGPGAWKGSIFRGSDWRFTGELIPSVIAENNGRGQRAWAYVGP